MPELGKDSSDDDLFRWFSEELSHNGAVREVSRGVLEVTIPPDELRSEEILVEVRISREQLRSLAWSDFDITHDDSDHAQTTSNPVLAGMRAVSIYAEEALATLRPGERYVVFDNGRLLPSTKPFGPALRAEINRADSEHSAAHADFEPRNTIEKDGTRSES
jgi:hypothetical protein